ncbi:hypothetical protein [Oligoflexus tunisiensis]|uniref:hypothetical protein n=1 Tax=Oligoflexus tunisiensis TaxID=708132 RepID=UPI000AA3F12B|nr:hypothetical protein [Oligoflexus tunisiensis]
MRNKVALIALVAVVIAFAANQFVRTQSVNTPGGDPQLEAIPLEKFTGQADTAPSMGAPAPLPESPADSAPVEEPYVETKTSIEDNLVEASPDEVIETKPAQVNVDKPVYASEKLNLPKEVVENLKYSAQDIGHLENHVLHMATDEDFKKYPSLETSKDLLRKVIGNYEGHAIWKNNGRSGEANLSIGGTVTDAKFLEGFYEFRVFDDGELRTRFEVPGHIGGSIRVVDEEQSGFIIEPQGKDGVQKLQLFLRQDGDRKYLIGNLYIANAKESGKFENVAILNMVAL